MNRESPASTAGAGSYRRGVALACGAVLLWSTFGAGTKLLLGRVPALVAVFYFNAAACAVLGTWAGVKLGAAGTWAAWRAAPGFYIWAGLLGFVVQQATYISAYAWMPASSVVIVFYTYPMMMTVISALAYGERVTTTEYVCVATGFAGVGVAIALGQPAAFTAIGVALALAGALSWAWFSLVLRHHTYSADAGMFWFSLVGTLGVGALLPVTTPGWTAIQFSHSEIAGMIYLGALPTAAAFILWSRALRAVAAPQAASLALLVPVLAMVVIAVLVGERIGVAQIAGLAVVVGSSAVAVRVGSGRPEPSVAAANSGA